VSNLLRLFLKVMRVFLVNKSLVFQKISDIEVVVVVMEFYRKFQEILCSYWRPSLGIRMKRPFCYIYVIVRLLCLPGVSLVPTA